MAAANTANVVLSHGVTPTFIMGSSELLVVEDLCGSRPPRRRMGAGRSAVAAEVPSLAGRVYFNVTAPASCARDVKPHRQPRRAVDVQRGPRLPRFGRGESQSWQ